MRDIKGRQGARERVGGEREIMWMGHSMASIIQ